MKIVGILLAALAVGYASYWQGHREGLRASPEFAKVQDAHNREIEAYFKEEFQNPTQRELFCDKVLEAFEETPGLLD